MFWKPFLKVHLFKLFSKKFIWKPFLKVHFKYPIPFPNLHLFTLIYLILLILFFSFVVFGLSLFLKGCFVAFTKAIFV